MKLKKMTNIVLVGLLPLFIAACGGGGGGGSTLDSGAVGSQSLSGVVSNNRVSGATLKVCPINNGVKDTNACQTFSNVTGNDGSYSITLNNFSADAIWAEASGGTYVDEATGETVTLDSLQAIAVLSGGTTTHILHITTVTHIAAALLGTNMSVDAINAANNKVKNALFGESSSIDIIMTEPADIRNSVNAGNQADYGLKLATLSQLRENRETEGITETLVEMLQAIANDLADNNQLDTSQDSLATATQQFLVSPYNQTELTANDTSLDVVHQGGILPVAPTSFASPTITLSHSVGDVILAQGTSISTQQVGNHGVSNPHYILDATSTINPFRVDKTSGEVTLANTVTTAGTYSAKVIAGNPAGAESYVIQLIVIAEPKIKNALTQVFTKDKAIYPLKFDNSGADATTCDITPSLPGGLELLVDDATCVLEGTPFETASVRTYQVTAGNDAGNSTASVTLSVIDQPSGMEIGYLFDSYIDKNFVRVLDVNEGGPARIKYTVSEEVRAITYNRDLAAWFAATNTGVYQLLSEGVLGTRVGPSTSFPGEIRGFTYDDRTNNYYLVLDKPDEGRHGVWLWSVADGLGAEVATISGNAVGFNYDFLNSTFSYLDGVDRKIYQYDLNTGDTGNVGIETEYNSFSLFSWAIPAIAAANVYLTPSDDIRSAIVGASSGDVIELAEGIYDLGRTMISVPSGVTVRGHGGGENTIIRVASPDITSSLPLFNVSNTDGVTIQNMTIELGAHMRAVRGGGIVKNASFSRLKIRGNILDKTAVGSSTVAFYMVDELNENISITENSIVNSLGGIYVKGTNIDISHNRLKRVNMGNIVTGGEQVSIKYNLIRESGKASEFNHGSGDTITLSASQNVAIQANDFETGYCYMLWATASVVNGIIEGNVVRDGITTGFQIQGADNVQVRNNYFGQNKGFGLYFFDSYHDVIIENNTFFADNVRLQPSAPSSAVVIRNNQFSHLAFDEAGIEDQAGNAQSVNNTEEHLTAMQLPRMQITKGGQTFESGDTVVLGLFSESAQHNFSVHNIGEALLTMLYNPTVRLSDSVTSPTPRRGSSNGITEHNGYLVHVENMPTDISVMPGDSTEFSVFFTPSANQFKQEAMLNIMTDENDNEPFWLKLVSYSLAAYPDTYAEWANAIFSDNIGLAGETADPDGDGIENRQEFIDKTWPL